MLYFKAFKLAAKGATFAGMLGIAGSAGATTNLIQNPGFESGDLDGWVHSYYRLSTEDGGVTPYEGTYFAELGLLYQFRGELSQDVATIAGASYDLSFAFNTGIDAGTAYYTYGDTKLWWNGSIVMDIQGGDLGWAVYMARQSG